MRRMKKACEFSVYYKKNTPLRRDLERRLNFRNERSECANTFARDRADAANGNNERFGIADRPACEFNVYFNCSSNFANNSVAELAPVAISSPKKRSVVVFRRKQIFDRRRYAERMGECGIFSRTSKCFVEKKCIESALSDLFLLWNN